MAIPESKLETWAKRHKTQKAKYTHSRIRDVIESFDYSKEEYEFETYLQGSYKNETNIWADTDVDIVVQLNSVLMNNITNLTLQQRELHRSYYSEATYTLEDFREEVITALYEGFGYERVQVGNKSVKVLADENQTMYDADIVICLQYRLYVPSKAKNTIQDPLTGLHYYEGIWFKTSWGDSIVNYPKLHYKNGVEKHQKTGGKFKKVVRIFKNMRNAAHDKGYLYAKEVAPSYFIQCLLYNAPDELYSLPTFSSIVPAILDWSQRVLQDSSTAETLISQNELVPLFGKGDDKWNINNAKIFINSLIYMWNEWE